MKILLVRTSADENTVFKNTYNEQEIGLAKNLIKKGHVCDVVYYANMGNKSIQKYPVGDKHITIYNIEGRKFLNTAIYNKEILDLCKKYDVIQVYECDKYMSWLIYSKYPEKTILYHGPYRAKFTWKHNLYTFFFYLIFKNRKNYKNAKILTKNNLARDYLKKIGFNNVNVIGVGLDSDKFLEQSTSSDNCSIYFDTAYKHLLYIGKVEKRRNISFLIEMFARLQNQRKNIKLVIIGDGNEKYYNKMKRQIEKHGIAEKVILVNSAEQSVIKKIYDSCDIFVFPTKYEIFGMVLLEAMYFGKPVITTLNGGSSTLITNNCDGIICDNYDYAYWIDCINNLLDNEEVAKKISVMAKNKIHNNYVWSVLVDSFINEYKNLLKG